MMAVGCWSTGYWRLARIGSDAANQRAEEGMTLAKTAEGAKEEKKSEIFRPETDRFAPTSALAS
jgi:hypothetical protein